MANRRPQHAIASRSCASSPFLPRATSFSTFLHTSFQAAVLIPPFNGKHHYIDRVSALLLLQSSSKQCRRRIWFWAAEVPLVHTLLLPASRRPSTGSALQRPAAPSRKKPPRLHARSLLVHRPVRGHHQHQHETLISCGPDEHLPIPLHPPLLSARSSESRVFTFLLPLVDSFVEAQRACTNSVYGEPVEGHKATQQRNREWGMVDEAESAMGNGFVHPIKNFSVGLQHPVESLPVTKVVAGFMSLYELANKIKLVYTMLTLPPTQRVCKGA